MGKCPLHDSKGFSWSFCSSNFAGQLCTVCYPLPARSFPQGPHLNTQHKGLIRTHQNVVQRDCTLLGECTPILMAPADTLQGQLLSAQLFLVKQRQQQMGASLDLPPPGGVRLFLMRLYPSLPRDGRKGPWKTGFRFRRGFGRGFVYSETGLLTCLGLKSSSWQHRSGLRAKVLAGECR